MGNWDGLLQEYVQELEKTHANGEGVFAADLSRLIPQAQEDEDAMKAAARKIACGGFRAAKSLLEGKMAAPPTAATNEEIANLAAIGIDEAEREQTKLQCMLAGKATGKSPGNHCQGCGETAQCGGCCGPQSDHEPRYHGGGEVARRRVGETSSRRRGAS